jgi:hypothetical protein
MNNFKLAIIITLLLQGCSFRTSYQVFVDNMNENANPLLQKVKYGINNRDTAYEMTNDDSHDAINLGKDMVYKKEYIGKDIYRYYYKKPGLNGYCKYSILVDKRAKKILSWQFEFSISEARKHCGR